LLKSPTKEKNTRANEIAAILCRQSKWLTHGRSIKITDFAELGLKITDFSTQNKLNEAILRYYTLLRMSFETNIYKIFETIESQIYRFALAPGQRPTEVKPKKVAEINFECPKCKERFLIQANLEKNIPLKKNTFHILLIMIFLNALTADLKII
jgi:hypothetical protein